MDSGEKQYIEDGVRQYFNALKDYKPLTKKEEHDLLRRYKENNDIVARNRLVTSNLKYAIKLATAYRGRGLNYDELISEANEALIDTIDKFDINQDVKLMCYSKWWIKQRIESLINTRNKMPFSEFNYTNDVSDCIYDSDSIDINDKDDYIYEYNDVSQNEKQTEETKFINTVLSTVSDRERDMLVMYYGLNGVEQKTLEEIGNMYSLTKERVRQIIEASFRKIRTNALLNDNLY